MQLQYFRGDQPNFGDELNTWLWPQLLPNFMDNDPSTLFLGIGSIIGTQYNPQAKKIVFGSGFVHEYHQIPKVHGEDWDIFFVRGPRTARALNIPEQLGIGDSAMLLRLINPKVQTTPRNIGFMPHWQSLTKGNWEKVCKLSGINLIDPRLPVSEVIAKILSCKVLISEAMHGAIVADVLRVPWIPILPLNQAHRAKWHDWADTLKIYIKQHSIAPSSAIEWRQLIDHSLYLSKIAWRLSQKPFLSLSDTIFTQIAAKKLYAISKKEPQLSSEKITNEILDKMQFKLHQLQEKYRKVA